MVHLESNSILSRSDNWFCFHEIVCWPPTPRHNEWFCCTCSYCIRNITLMLKHLIKLFIAYSYLNWTTMVMMTTFGSRCHPSWKIDHILWSLSSDPVGMLHRFPHSSRSVLGLLLSFYCTSINSTYFLLNDYLIYHN